MTEAFESDDKLRPLASLSSVLVDTKKEQFLVKAGFGNRLKWAEVLTVASIVVPAVIAIIQFTIRGGK